MYFNLISAIFFKCFRFSLRTVIHFLQRDDENFFFSFMWRCRGANKIITAPKVKGQCAFRRRRIDPFAHSLCSQFPLNLSSLYLFTYPPSFSLSLSHAHAPSNFSFLVASSPSWPTIACAN